MIGTAEIAMIWLAGSTIGSSLFWGVFLLGRLASRVERAERRIEEIDHALDRAGQRMSDLADDVQKIPDRFITRSEALTWRGSRVEDKA